MMKDEVGNPKSTAPVNLAVLVSGSGTTLQNLLDVIGAGKLAGTVSTVVGSRSGLQGIERAVAARIPATVVDRKRFSSVAEFTAEVFRPLDQAGVDLVCLAGWLCLLDVPAKYVGRVMNIHPSLLPAFGGKGMYGQKVHQAVLDHGCKVTGCTVHFVDQAYDTGPIILQRTCPVRDDDTAETLASRVFEEEKMAYPEAIRLFQQKRLKINGRRVNVW